MGNLAGRPFGRPSVRHLSGRPFDSPDQRISSGGPCGLPDLRRGTLRSPEPPGLLADLPLREEGAEGLPETVSDSGTLSTAAALGDRGMAFAADAATVVLVVAIALLAAVAVRGEGPRLSGLVWAAAFGFYFSFFASVAALLLFGRTVGLALAGLRVREGAHGRGLTVSEAARRWFGTLATVAVLGIPLLWIRRDRALPTLADRLSGRALVKES